MFASVCVLYATFCNVCIFIPASWVTLAGSNCWALLAVWGLCGLCGPMHQGFEGQRILRPQEEAVGATVPERCVWQCALCCGMQARPPPLHCSPHAPPGGKTPPRVEQVSLPSPCFPGTGQAHSSWNEDWVHQEESRHQAVDHQNPTGTGALAAAHCWRRVWRVWVLWFRWMGSTQD